MAVSITPALLAALFAGYRAEYQKALAAAQQAIESPLLEVSIDGARGVLFNVTGGHDMSMHEINEAAEAISSTAVCRAVMTAGGRGRVTSPMPRLMTGRAGCLFDRVGGKR